MKIKTKYIILFWVLILILFTFYCIFRIKYISDKTQEKYINIPFPIPSATNANVIDWINNIESTSTITEISNECKYVYDDNIGVGVLGYSNCQTAFNDYVVKGFDVNNNYGQSKTLADICPVSTKSPLYAQCLKQLIYKFTNSANIINNVNSDMTNLLNTRLYDRNTIVNSISTDMKPFMSTADQTNFIKFMNDNNSVAQTPDDVFNMVGNYYGNRYNSGYNVGYGKTVEGFSNSNSENTTSQSILELFFGYYTPLAGQFLVLDNINMILGYDITNNEQSTLQQNNTILTITNTDGFHLIANVDSIDNFNNVLNTVILKISNINIINNSTNPSNAETLQQLLSILGVNELTYLIITYEEYTSSENILHKTYKLVNENLDTIMLLNKT